MRFSIRSYAILFSCCIVVVAIGIFAISMLSYLSGLTRDELKERGRLSAATLEAQIDKDVALDDLTAASGTCHDAIESSGELSYVVVSLKDGPSLVLLPGRRWSEEHVKAWHPFEDEDSNTAIIESPIDGAEVLHYAVPIKYGGVLSPGWLHVGMSPQSYHDNMGRFKKRTTAMALAALAFGIPASLVFGRMLTRPITRLQTFAENVAEGDLESRVEARGSKEIIDLAETMNWMTGRVAESQERMKESLKKEASLREKEVLLREIHHRVKNNMQVLGGLIRIQCRTLEDGEARDVLIESETRIRSMALLHQKLYQSDSISEISFAGYVEMLIGELRRLYSGCGGTIGIEVDIPEGFRLGLDTALPCGLIVNELVSNSFKYGFPDGASGEIRIVLRPEADGRFGLEIGDTGVGMPEDFDLENARSLGLRLVNMLVEQLDGTIELGGGGAGSRFRMDLKPSSYAERLEPSAPAETSS